MGLKRPELAPVCERSALRSWTWDGKTPESARVTKISGRFFFHDVKTGLRHPYRCGSWRCKTCAPRLRRRLAQSLGRWAQYYNMDKFWTLTLDPAKIDYGAIMRHIRPDEELCPGEIDDYRLIANRYLQATWAKFRVRLNRYYPGAKYIVIREYHAKGVYMHLHILTNVYIPFRWMQAGWEAYGGGHRVHVQRVNVRNATAYAVKYLAKSGHGADIFPRYARHYSVSKDIAVRYTPAQWCARPATWGVCREDRPPETRDEACATCCYARDCGVNKGRWILYDSRGAEYLGDRVVAGNTGVSHRYDYPVHPLTRAAVDRRVEQERAIEYDEARTLAAFAAMEGACNDQGYSRGN